MNLSVIIPTLNEEATLPSLLRALNGEDAIDEIIVVDGGSDDRTREIAVECGARLIMGPRGRGQQLCTGADAARGQILWFLHADTLPGPGAATSLCTALSAQQDAPGGNFAVTFDGPTRFAEWLNGFYAWLRSHGIYYGDSAIFVRREIYQRMGGMRATALMEDYEFTRRMERLGPTLNIGTPGVVTSSRRFQNRSPWRIVLQWLVIHAMYYVRMPGDRMAGLYQSERHMPGRSDDQLARKSR